MDKENKIKLLYLLIKIKSERKTLRQFFSMAVKDGSYDKDVIDKLLDRENQLRKIQEEIEKQLNY